MSFRGRSLRGEEVEVPPGLVGYVMAMDEKGQVSGEKHSPAGSENGEALERDFVSTGESSWQRCGRERQTPF